MRSTGSAIAAHLHHKSEGQVAGQHQGCQDQGGNEEEGQSDQEDRDWDTGKDFIQIKLLSHTVPRSISTKAIMMIANTEATKVIEAITKSKKPLHAASKSAKSSERHSKQRTGKR